VPVPTSASPRAGPPAVPTPSELIASSDVRHRHNGDVTASEREVLTSGPMQLVDGVAEGAEVVLTGDPQRLNPVHIRSSGI